MLNNEQRAHDIAITILPYVISATEAYNDDRKINIVDEYLKAYNKFLNDLNEKANS